MKKLLNFFVYLFAVIGLFTSVVIVYQLTNGTSQATSSSTILWMKTLDKTDGIFWLIDYMKWYWKTETHTFYLPEVMWYNKKKWDINAEAIYLNSGDSFNFSGKDNEYFILNLDSNLFEENILELDIENANIQTYWISNLNPEYDNRLDPYRSITNFVLWMSFLTLKSEWNSCILLTNQSLIDEKITNINKDCKIIVTPVYPWYKFISIEWRLSNISENQEWKISLKLHNAN